MFSTEEFVLLTCLTTFYWDVMWNLEKSCLNITTHFCRSLNCPPSLTVRPAWLHRYLFPINPHRLRVTTRQHLPGPQIL